MILSQDNSRNSPDRKMPTEVSLAKSIEKETYPDLFASLSEESVPPLTYHQEILKRLE